MLLHATRFYSNFAKNLIGISALAAVAIWAGPGSAQTPSIMEPGDTIVTGFSGVLPPVPPFPSGDAIDETFINLGGSSMQIQRPQPSSPPAGQLIPAPTVFVAPASAVGQVFAITLDDQAAPNIFLAASSVYGLQIVTPDSDGDGRPERVRTGQADAAFMDGQWGAGGAPGSIYRVDGTTGAITLFTTIGANAGPGLGDIVFDRATHQFFVSDLDTGLIYRLDWTGTILDAFDHGMTGRPANGLAAVPDDGSTMNVADPAFDSENPATWGYTQPERAVWGLAMHAGRLFYAVGDGPSIWSVGINLDGTIANDPRWELDVAGLASADPISDIVFDASGRMIVAQRGAQRGSYDYTVFAEPQQSSVVRYRREIPDDPTTPSVWVQVPDEYAIGFRPDGHNSTGGVALGYDYDAAGQLNVGACYQYLWSTGDSLRENDALAAALAAGGPAIVHGLQGNDENLVRPQNDPPFNSYFTDYDNTYEDPENQGHMGDVEIWQPCIGYTPPYFPPPPYTPPPPVFDLKIDKRAFDCLQVGDNWFCGYVIRVSNDGTTPYWGPLTVEDWLPSAPAGATMTFAPQPLWLCGAITPTDQSCSFPPVFLLPGDGVDLYVGVKLPYNYKPCSLDNAARIVWPLGWGDANPANDAAFASAQILSKKCEPPTNPKTNLKIQKYPVPKVCTDDGTNWVCTYLVQVTNTGPGVYNGPIKITDTLSSGTPLVASAPWTCVPSGPNWTCDRPPVVLNPGASVFMWAQTSIAKAAQVDAQQCSITNRVKIDEAPGGSQQNSNPGDDDASAEALTPGENCEPFGEPTDLSIKKVSNGCASYTSTNDEKRWLCGFTISVKNESDNDFFAPISVHDDMSVAQTPPWPWFIPGGMCTPNGGGGYDCNTIGSVHIAPHMSMPPIHVVVSVPDDGETCHIDNTATIAAPLGPIHNTDGSNDEATASADIPSSKCNPVLLDKIAPENACPILQRMPDGGCCPDGENWNGKSCGNAPPPECPPNTTGKYPNGLLVNKEPPKATPKCPQGTTGRYPNCVKIVQPKCPQGTTGKYPNCVKIVQPKCPEGTSGRYPNCVKILQPVCPQGTTGKYPNCVKIVQPKCPQGTTGRYPNCVKIVAPVCPNGTTGKYPNCVKIVRPTPNIQGGGQTLTPTQPEPPKCPAGTTGIWPLCIPNQQNQLK